MRNTFIYYSRISIKEGVDTDGDKPDIKDTNRKCSCCKEVFIISKNFEFDEQNCNGCYNITSRLIADLVKCLYFGLIMLFFESSQIYV